MATRKPDFRGVVGREGFPENAISSISVLDQQVPLK
jgi:hypothetical protein